MLVRGTVLCSMHNKKKLFTISILIPGTAVEVDRPVYLFLRVLQRLALLYIHPQYSTDNLKVKTGITTTKNLRKNTVS